MPSVVIFSRRSWAVLLASGNSSCAGGVMQDQSLVGGLRWCSLMTRRQGLTRLDGPRSRSCAAWDSDAVSKHGRVIGFYIPLERDEDEVRRAIAKLGETVGQVLEETGLSEEQLAQLFDLPRQHAK